MQLFSRAVIRRIPGARGFKFTQYVDAGTGTWKFRIDPDGTKAQRPISYGQTAGGVR